jgi:hypothetical protein
MAEDFDHNERALIMEKIDLTEKMLREMYIDQKMSQAMIAVNTGHCQQYVSARMKQFNIQARSFSESSLIYNDNEYHKPLTQIEKEIVLGELLGDGNVDRSLNSPNCMPRYRHSNKHAEYLDWLASQLPSLVWGRTTYCLHKAKRKNGTPIESYGKVSMVHEDLKEIHDNFYKLRYDEKKKKMLYKKIVPVDLEITPAMLKHWYLGDGCCCWGKTRHTSNRIPKERHPSITLSCEGHDNKTLEIYMAQIKDKYGIEFRMQKEGDIIRVENNSIEKFFDVIGECPIECYRYKWNYKNDPYSPAESVIGYIKNYFQEHNCVLLNETVNNYNDKLQYTCECGEIAEISFKKFKDGCRCKKCGNKKIGDIKRPSFESIKELFSATGLTLLEDHYVNNKTKMRCICSCGNETTKIVDNLKSGFIGCRKCAHKKEPSK